MTVESVAAPGLMVAFAAGTLSFVSPCCAPLVPAYLSYIGGVTADNAQATRRQRAFITAGSSMLFILGFTTVFVFLGVGASMLGIFVQEQRPLLAKISGGFMIAMGLAVAGMVRLPFMYQEKRFQLASESLGPAGPMLLGMAFAFGWTPCMGPVLASILLYSGTVESGGQGGFLLLSYSLGLGVPFLLTGILWSQGLQVTRLFRRFYSKISLASGALLVTMGGLLLFDKWFYISVWTQRLWTRLL